MTTANQLSRALKNPSIFVTYTDINRDRQKFISDLFFVGQAIILVRVGETFGHWCCVRVDFQRKIIYYFSSFGTIPDHDKNVYISPVVNRRLRQKMNVLSQIMKDYFHNALGFKMRYNHVRYQDPNDASDQSCGLWCVLFLNSELDEERFEEIVKKYCKSLKISFKEFINKYFTNGIGC